MSELRVVSWNMAHRTENWSTLHGLLGDGPAVDSSRRHQTDDTRSKVPPLWRRTDPTRGRRTPATPARGPRELSLPARSDSWGGSSASGSRDRRGADRESPGSFAAALVSVAGGDEIGVVSIYGIWDRQSGVGNYAEATLHRTISTSPMAPAPTIRWPDHCG